MVLFPPTPSVLSGLSGNITTNLSLSLSLTQILTLSHTHSLSHIIFIYLSLSRYSQYFSVFSVFLLPKTISLKSIPVRHFYAPRVTWE